MSSKLERCKSESIRTHHGPPERYQLQLKRVNLDKLPDNESKLRRFTLGECDPKYQNRTILMVGATGTGKSTLINALVNYVMGVTFEDKVWFEIIADEKDRPQSDSQTSEVSVYEVFGFEGTVVPYSLTIIDTPGYGDTRGKEFDDIVTKKLQDLFTVPEGVAVIDVVGLVLKASENRLDERMAYIFNSVTSLFGKDMEKNIVTMMTHSDGAKPTNALQALKDANIKCAIDEQKLPIHFLFNNRQKEEIEVDKRAERAARNAFETTEDGMKDFTDFLGQSKPQSLKSTVKVMKERIRLTACIQNLKERVNEVEMKQMEIQSERAQLGNFTREMMENKDFTFQAQEPYKAKEKINDWWDNKAVTCGRCEENCHYQDVPWL
uniref:AIG1-type G domain-containing protein n=1 Tax=Neogobius melanostomus TaxID=47308 RepID=A0A8C6UNB2_9GOBI